MKRKKLNLTSNSSNSILYKKKKKKKILQILHTSMNIDRYKSVEPGQYNENNFGRTSGERSFPVRHGCHPIHESSLDSRGSYVSDSSEKLNRIPPLPLPRDGLAPSKSVPLAPKPPPNRLHRRAFLLTLPAGDNDFLAPRKRARAPFTPLYYTLGGGATIASLRDTTAEQMPDLQNRGAVNNREMKRTECLFAKIRDRGRSVPLYAACRVWRCDRYMDGIMEKKREKRKKRGRGGNRGKKMGTIRKRPLLFGTARAMVSGRIDRCVDRVRGVHNFWMILELWIVYLFEIFGRR